MTTKRTLLTSAVSLVLCICMLLGTTFAWFTDAVTSSGNIIASGNLDAEMYWSDKLLAADSDEWNNADGTSVFNYNNWEPGYTEVRYVKVSNAGSLNFRWKLTIEADGEVTDLSDVIDVYYVNPVANELTKDNIKSLTSVGTLTDVLENNTALDGRQLTPGSSAILAIAFHMDELAGNDYQNKSLCDAGFSLKLIATQDIGESDSFGDDYDGNAFADIFAGFQGGSAGAAVTTNDEGATTSAVSMSGGDVSAEVPAGVKVADGVKSLELVISMMDASGANIQLGATEVKQSLDVHMEGVAEGNTIPMLITLREYLPTGLNSGALKIYHVEDGNTVVMTQAANPTNHNEFSYDPSTGSVTLAMASFSEVAVVADATNPWDGKTLDYSWYINAVAPVDYESATVYTIANADQLAAFATIVDGTAKDIAQDSFKDKIVMLNNNIYLEGYDSETNERISFEPIGWGYENDSHNRKYADGKPMPGRVFKGTFDGNGNIIFDLYQNGWDLEYATGTDYTYTNCGFGLFAAASGATFQNLTIYGAYVRVECVEAGILVGLSQNNCIYDTIEIVNSKIANYQRPAGGLIGEVSGDGTTTITDVTIGADVVVGSLWGDFDAPCGGVIGARWDDVNANPQIAMENVKVHCRMDVYSDVTSAYQWYAYRRAGMLIGNTELSDPDNKHLAYAKSFLTCKNVEVCYGDWANYHYAQFTTQDDEWCNNYPWVRVEAGENCSAYSNPRYGVPVIDGVKVSDMNAETLEVTRTDFAEITFSQLYGGGQGVYGQAKHDGVTVTDYRYSITYINDGQVLAVKYVTENGAVSTENGAAQDLVERWIDDNITNEKVAFGGWMNAGSTVMTTISADNDEDIILYPSYKNLYTAMFLDQEGNIIDWYMVEANQTIQERPVAPELEGFTFWKWEVHVTDGSGNTTNVADLDGYKVTSDVAIYPAYKYNGNINLTPVDSDGDGKTNYYQVDGLKITLDDYNNMSKEDQLAYMKVNIPAYVGNGIPVSNIVSNAFSQFADLEVIYVPATIDYIGTNAFVKKGEDEQITIYFDGTKAKWDELEKGFASDWDKYIGTGSHIYFSDGSSYEKKGLNGLYTYWK